MCAAAGKRKNKIHIKICMRMSEKTIQNEKKTTEIYENAKRRGRMI